MPLEEVRSKVLHAAIYDHAKVRRNPFLGEVRLNLDSVDFDDATSLEYALAEKVSLEPWLISVALVLFVLATERVVVIFYSLSHVTPTFCGRY